MVFTVNCPALAAPFGGSAALAAKGVSSVILRCYHSTNHTPSVSLALDSSPTGEPSPTAPERGGGPRVSVAEGFAARRIPIRKTKANPYNLHFGLYGFAFVFVLI